MFKNVKIALRIRADSVLEHTRTKETAFITNTDSIFLLRFYSQSPRPGRGLSAPSKAHLKDRNGIMKFFAISLPDKFYVEKAC
jgi:hypothetical protein